MKKTIGLVMVAVLLLSGCSGKKKSEPALSSSSLLEASSVVSEAASQLTPESTSLPVQQATFKLVVPEGYTLARIGIMLEEMGVCTNAEFIEAAQTGDFSTYSLVNQQVHDVNRCFLLEGYLFPDTYEFYSTATPHEIIGTMLNNLEKRIDPALREEIAQSGFTVEEVLTMASIIEKEAFGQEQMANISSVLHNRLAIGMMLQTDVTIKYVEGAIKPFITGDINRYNSYYNTYKCPALPAGPICNPGMAAVCAALRPAQTEYLYFLTDSDKNYYYAVTWEEHLANKAAAGIE